MDLLVVAGAVVVVLGLLIGALMVRSRQHEQDEVRVRSQSQPPPRRARDRSRPRSEREVRSGARHLTTEPETDEARALKQRLTEAVSDLADSVEEMPVGGERRLLTSQEMITRAKERIRQRARDPEL